MRITIRNFGPIYNANIDIAPLTVIIGKNNLGKSYIAQLIHSVSSSIPPGYISRRFLHVSPWRRSIPIGLLEEIVLKAKKEEVSPQVLTERLIDYILERSIALSKKIIKSSIERSFATDVAGLVRVGARNAEFNFYPTRYIRLRFRLLQSGNTSVKLIPNQKGLHNLRERIIVIAREILNLKEIYSNAMVRRLVRIYSEIFGELGSQPSIYIPAGRAGLLESYDTVVSALISASPRAAIDGIMVPPLPGMAAQLYLLMQRLGGEEGPLADISEEFKEIFKGDVILTKQPRQIGVPRMSYRFRLGANEASVGIIHAASMVKELAPIYLIIRELIRPGYLIMFEEPESHLHPSAQCQLIRIIAKLVNRGVRIMLTTHSDIVLRKLVHLVGQYNLNPDLPDSLSSEKVAVYLLREGTNGSISEKIHIPKSGLMDEFPTFDDVIRELYEKELQLQRHWQETKGD